jgi:hypothetical protein
MSKLAQGLLKDLPPYTDFIQVTGVTKETPEQSMNRLVDKVNKYVEGNNEYI